MFHDGGAIVISWNEIDLDGHGFEVKLMRF